MARPSTRAPAIPGVQERGCNQNRGLPPHHPLRHAFRPKVQPPVPRRRRRNRPLLDSAPRQQKRPPLGRGRRRRPRVPCRRRSSRHSPAWLALARRRQPSGSPSWPRGVSSPARPSTGNAFVTPHVPVVQTVGRLNSRAPTGIRRPGGEGGIACHAAFEGPIRQQRHDPMPLALPCPQ